MYVWRVYYEAADTDEPRRFIGSIQGDSMGQALERAAQLYEIPVYDLVVERASKKDLQALHAAEEHVANVYTTYTRNTTERWELDAQDAAKLRYNDSPGRQDGYLIVKYVSSRIVEYTNGPDGEEWTIEVVPDVGFLLDPEEYRVYQADNGDWIVEQ